MLYSDRNLTSFNDIHIGAVRSAGTTLLSAYELRQSLLNGLKDLMSKAEEDDVLLNGDLFDTHSISLADLFITYNILASWLDLTGNVLYGSQGNHDLSKTSSVFSSFQLLMRLLVKQYPNQVVFVSELTEIRPGTWVLPHLPNQDLFEASLAKVPECDFLFVHANFDNKFAMQSDNSLNISREQALDCKARTIVFGHEHQGKHALDGKVVIVGNQLASSVSDCLGNKKKYYCSIAEGELELVEYADVDLIEMDWQKLGPVSQKFIRVTGEATPEQGSEVANAISRYRATSPAYVITNAVDMLVDGGKMAEFANSLENVQAFDVDAALKSTLTAEEVAVLESLT